jgi:hypothetical protein
MSWYTDYICPTVHCCCDENNYPRRALLLSESAPGHPPNIGKRRRAVDVMVEYLLPNTSSLLQPMGQGIVANFKAYYLWQTCKGVCGKWTTVTCLSRNVGCPAISRKASTASMLLGKRSHQLVSIKCGLSVYMISEDLRECKDC